MEPTVQNLISAFANQAEWIIVDSLLLRAAGLTGARDTDNKKRYKKMLMEKFAGYFEDITRADPRAKTIAGKDRVVFAVRPTQFVETMKMINTKEARDILRAISHGEQERTHDLESMPAMTPIATFNAVDLRADNASELPMMDVYDFAMAFRYDIDKLYIDKFWHGINDDAWLIIDRQMLKWIGYNCMKDSDNKKLYMNILSNNFIRGEDFDVVAGPVEFDERVQQSIGGKNTLIVSTRAFEMSLMMVRTHKASAIRRYFQTLGRIMRDYLTYTRQVNEYNLRLENIQWKQEVLEYKRIVDDNQCNLFDIDTKPIVPKEYVYILTSKRYYRKSIFKIGKSVRPDKRIISHNTTAATNDDTMFYTHVIPTLDCGALEKTLHALLVRYHHTKEWYRLPHAHLLSIINVIVENQTQVMDIVNKQLREGDFDAVEPLPMTEFASKMQDVIQAERRRSSRSTEQAATSGTDATPAIDKASTDPVAIEQAALNDTVAMPASDKVSTDPVAVEQAAPNDADAAPASYKASTEFTEPTIYSQPSSIEILSQYIPYKDLTRRGLHFHCSLCPKKFLSKSKASKHILAHYIAL